MIRFVILLAFLPFTFAHTGFNQLSWQEPLGPYSMSVLEDFHVAEQSAKVFVQLSQGNEAAPGGSSVHAEISYEDSLIYEGEADFLMNGRDNNGAYAAFLVDAKISEGGLYKLELFVKGPLGDVSQMYFVQAKNESRVSLLEYLPSVLILLICVGGALLLFVPVKTRKDAVHETNHHQFSHH